MHTKAKRRGRGRRKRAQSTVQSARVSVMQVSVLALVTARTRMVCDRVVGENAKFVTTAQGYQLEIARARSPFNQKELNLASRIELGR